MAMIEIDRHPAPRTLRQFAGLFLVAFGVIGYLLLRRTESMEAAAMAWGLAALVFLVGMIRPQAIRLVYVGLIYLAFPIGWVVSHILLAIVLYFVFTPIGWALRLLGRGPLERGFDLRAESYWTPHRQPASIDRYFRQF
jgi:hypothetical protein